MEYINRFSQKGTTEDNQGTGSQTTHWGMMGMDRAKVKLGHLHQNRSTWSEIRGVKKTDRDQSKAGLKHRNGHSK